MGSTFIRCSIFIACLFVSLPSFAEVMPSFSAQVVQSGPAGNAELGKLYFANGFFRIEEHHSSGAVISLVQFNKPIMTTIFPERHYFSTLQGNYRLPPWTDFLFLNRYLQCNSLSGVNCIYRKTEDIYGRESDRWEILAPVPARQTLWLDREHGFVIKSMHSSGVQMELRLTGLDTVEGRVVEKWSRTSSFRDEAPTISYQWYDPRLKLVIKEALPGGYVRRLSGLRIGEQPEHLFRVPRGFKAINPPTRNL